jgi:DNA-binding beta-propeller fold protein YncE
LDKQADLYVANRGNNTIVRMRQDGTVVAVRRIRLSDGRGLGDLRLNGIATSSDGSKVWVTMTGHLPGFGQLSGAVLELSAF